MGQLTHQHNTQCMHTKTKPDETKHKEERQHRKFSSISTISTNKCTQLSFNFL